MNLSIIIVSYNVKSFLEQCLYSVRKAIGDGKQIPGSGQEAEVIVVDNASSDGTVDWLQLRFPFVRFISNKENIGFAKANNQALRNARGQFILFLNPDTIVPEYIIDDCISFFQTHARAGALGLRMIDGSGKFLPESKRGFPTAWRSFCKLSGLSALFPGSKLFAGYNLGYLKEDQVQEIEALAGAFMMVRKEVLQLTGGFDERFFMYAEDIDLSKRIKDAGYENYYLGTQAILHFKGESTKKDLQYVKLFYLAMAQYVQKHYTGVGSRFMVGLIKTGIWIRAALASTTAVKQETANSTLRNVLFKGDQQSISDLKDKLNRSGKPLNEEPDAENIIYCEGENFSFTDLIEAIKKLPPTKKVLVHASGSDSVVGSFNKRQMGTTMTIASS